MRKQKFAIKNKSGDSWARFLFNEVEKDEKRPSGQGWLDINQLTKLSGKKRDNLRTVLNSMRHMGLCTLFNGQIRNDKGFIVKHVWYQANGNTWSNYLKHNKFQISRQRIPSGKDWFTVTDLEKKTGFARSKILRLIKEHKLTNKIKVFDGYRYNPKKNFLERKMWYKLCQNG